MYKIISVYRSFIAAPGQVLIEVHSEAFNQYHSGQSLKAAKAIAIEMNNMRIANNKRPPEDRYLLSGEFFYVKKGNKAIDVGQGVGDLGQAHADWAASQRPGYQQELFQ